MPGFSGSGGVPVSVTCGLPDGAAEIVGTIGRDGLGGPGLPTSDEGSTMAQFQSDDGSFMVNWPFAWPAANETAPDVVEDGTSFGQCADAYVGDTSYVPREGDVVVDRPGVQARRGDLLDPDAADDARDEGAGGIRHLRIYGQESVSPGPEVTLQPSKAVALLRVPSA